MEGYASSVDAEGKVRLEVGLVKNEKESSDGILHVRVSAEEKAKRVPMNVICLVDTSGSMNLNVQIRNADGSSENTSLNVLDLAKHAVLTVANGMNKDDMLSIIGWASMPDTHPLKLTRMDEEGHKAAKRYLDSLDANYSTGMIEALRTGFESVEDNGLPTAIFLLTDGEPDEEPDGGFGKLVTDLMDKTGKDVSVNTFGFGYNLNSELLMDISQAGHGTFGFIPDAGLLGTVMVNGLASTLTNAASNTQVSLELCEGISLAEGELRLPKGSLTRPIVNSDGSVIFNIGAVAYEQPRSIALPVKIAPSFKAGSPVACVSVNCLSNGKRISVAIEDAVTEVLPSMRLSFAEALAARAKTVFADALFDVIGEHLPDSPLSILPKANETFRACAAELKRLLASVGDSEKIRDVIRDCEGQATEAVSKPEYFSRWGKHYLRSLCVAHEFEICNNFKDPGVQHYGGALFASIRDELDDIFQTLPPPGDRRERRSRGGVHRSRGGGGSPRIQMSRFMDVSAGCFAGSCVVFMPDGSKKRVADIKKGDVVNTGSASEQTATVICVVEHPAGGDVVTLTPSGLVITPWHPIDVEGNDAWTFPAKDSTAVHKKSTESVFTFVLDRAHSVVVNGVRCVTLAHTIVTGNDARAHPYFGSNACISDLQKYFPKEYEAGHVLLPVSATFTRDASTNLVNGLSL